MKKKLIFGCFGVLALMCFLLLLLNKENVFAGDGMYENAKDFFENTGEKDDRHIDIVNGIIYFGTAGKKASSSTSLKYATLGFDVTKHL